MTSNLQESLLDQKRQTEQYNQPIYGILGIPLGGQRLVEVPNRNGYVYVRLRNNQSETIQAFNNKVSPAYNLPVIVERQGGRYAVVSVDTERYENNWNSFAPFLPRHGNTHSFDIESGGGGDIVWVYPRQFIPAMVMPSGSLGAGNVFVNAYTLKEDDGSWSYVGNTGTQVLTIYNPPSGSDAVMVLVYLDTSTGNPSILVGSGSYFANTITGSSQIVPYIPSVSSPTTQIPLAAIRLITGTNAISWDNIYDVRQFVHNIPTGTGGGSASINTGTLNSLYLRLDASNDPVTHTLDITTAGEAASYQTARNAVGMYVDQRYSGTYTAHAPGLYLDRIFDDNTNNIFNEAGYYLADHSASGSYARGMFRHVFDDATISELNEYATPTGVMLYSKSRNQLTPDGRLLLLQNQNLDSFYVDGSGTAHSNGSPLIKEAPVDGNQYARKNAGWEQVSASGDVGGWISDSNTWTYHSADSPSYVVSVDANVTGTIGVGMKVQLSHQSQTKFFIPTAISVTGSVTYLNLYGGTNYTLNVTGTISNPKYSYDRTPFGFPTDPTNWQVLVTSAADCAKASPAGSTWYGGVLLSPTGPSIDIPIGVWNVEAVGVVNVVKTTASAENIGFQMALSTANNSASDNDLKSSTTVATPALAGAIVRQTMEVKKTLEIASKTTYYVNLFTGALSVTSLTLFGSTVSTTKIRARCVYL